MSLIVLYKGEQKTPREIAEIAVQACIENHSKRDLVRTMLNKIESPEYKMKLDWVICNSGSVLPEGFCSQTSLIFKNLYLDAMWNGKIPNPNHDPVLRGEEENNSDVGIPDPNKDSILRSDDRVLVDPIAGAKVVPSIHPVGKADKKFVV